MNGIIVLDKPAGMTSAQVVARVKRILKAKKVGHTGTLDPFATGVLVCCINKATRLARFLTEGKKRYIGTMRLGIRTDTQDLTGEVVSTEPELTVKMQEVHGTFREFMDMKHQTPPAYSALKHNGVPLYRLARRGTFIQKPPRRIHIYGLRVLEVNLPDVRFEVCCSAGTYVRTMCADIGDALGCGAHLTELCRTETGMFSLDEAISLDALERLAAMGKTSDCIVPMSLALRGIPCVSADTEVVEKIQRGHGMTQKEVTAEAEKASPWIKVTDNQGNLVAVVSATMRNGVYPYACVFPSLESDRE